MFLLYTVTLSLCPLLKLNEDDDDDDDDILEKMVRLFVHQVSVPGDGRAGAVVDVVLQRPAADLQSSNPADLRQDSDYPDDPRSHAAGHWRLHLQGHQRARRGDHQNVPSS